MQTRTETDSMGPMQVPIDALYGASTARAIQNFPIANRPLPKEVIHAFGHLKAACAAANRDLGKLDPQIAQAIIDASSEVAAGKHDAHFPVDVYQTGSGTSTNMNANEVIANLATARLPGVANSLAMNLTSESSTKIHPNDHVNMGQSSNDTFPTAMNIAAAVSLKYALEPAITRLSRELERLATDWDTIVKVGRTHLMDATPIRVGQVFSGYGGAARDMLEKIDWSIAEMEFNLAIGGTAVGTGINTHADFAARVASILSKKVSRDTDDLTFAEAANHPHSQATKDNFVTAHGYLKMVAVSLTKIANDIRLLASGPRCGIGELIIPAIQPGSSIMPGKENPVICESVMQVACRVIGNDAAITTANLGGVGSIFELNVAMPVIIDAFLESTNLLANVCNVFVDKLLAGLQVNKARCAELVEASLMNVTALAPVIGYDQAAKVAKQAMAESKTIRQIVRELNLLDDEAVDKLLNYDAMTRPSPSR